PKLWKDGPVSTVRIFFGSSADGNPGKGQSPWPLSCSTSWFDCIVPMRISKAYQIVSRKSDKFRLWQDIRCAQYCPPGWKGSGRRFFGLLPEAAKERDENHQKTSNDQ